jgi:hypothetical protein
MVKGGATIRSIEHMQDETMDKAFQVIILVSRINEIWKSRAGLVQQKYMQELWRLVSGGCTQPCCLGWVM